MARDKIVYWLLHRFVANWTDRFLKYLPAKLTHTLFLSFNVRLLTFTRDVSFIRDTSIGSRWLSRSDGEDGVYSDVVVLTRRS